VSSAQDVIAAHLSTAVAPCVTSSFQIDGVVLLHMIRQHARLIPVLFIDTAHHFAETLKYRDDLVRAWNLNLVVVQADRPSPGLWRVDSEACCARHKVAPLFAALKRHDVWFTGLRRAQSPSRAALEAVHPFTLPSGEVLRKVNPLADWTDADVWEYARAHEIPALPLYAEGFASIGCEPCTTRPVDPLNPRSGRWNGKRLECGIHVTPG
jgi:phosphoadenosine phosphosulfate reductase